MKEFDELISIVRRLRAPGGCPWDRAQKLKDYKKFLLEETYELVDALERKDFDAIKEELGDLFLILTVIAEMLRQKNKASCPEVLTIINDKLVHRHPHVFASKTLATKEQVLKYWIKHKAKKKKRKTVSDRLPSSAPALLLADLLLKESAHIRGNHKSKRDTRTLIKNIEDISLRLKTKGVSTALFAELLMAIAHLGFARKLDLELILRKEVFRRAAGLLYR